MAEEYYSGFTLVEPAVPYAQFDIAARGLEHVNSLPPYYRYAPEASMTQMARLVED
jgi:hypothetical protein